MDWEDDRWLIGLAILLVGSLTALWIAITAIWIGVFVRSYAEPSVPGAVLQLLAGLGVGSLLILLAVRLPSPDAMDPFQKAVVVIGSMLLVVPLVALYFHGIRADESTQLSIHRFLFSGIWAFLTIALYRTFWKPILRDWLERGGAQDATSGDV